ncbi:hypothetical protein VA596_05910 [Amycolatopsis sp., V23-08]|uniref:Uncharacterized protein n=1 Tax=Amycolatopsis heterodermiae TaxID=3110235 RepID=A0ABU5R007_9PSEU|nr:hypothetical protein [Amycolatopsis sp., V23-08]MEA5359064.1 hypothetical protein [Amycolatopsis sp., V23-08]
MTDTPDVPLAAYPGLPKGSFRVTDLPRPAAMALGSTDEGVWTAAAATYLSVIDPATGKPDHDRPLADTAAGTIQNAAATCHAQALEYSAPTDDRAAEQDLEAAKHLAEAVDTIEHASGILNDPITGPDGEKIDGRRIQVIHHQDEQLARQRSAEGDSRHTQRSWEKAWRILASTLLGVMDAILLWKPLLNLSFTTGSDNALRWAIGLGMVSLQVLAIEWAARTFVSAERLSVDRRGAAADYNRPFRHGRSGPERPAPTTDEIAEADQQYSHAYYGLVGVAAAVAMIGGVRVAWLARQADLPVYEAVLFGIVIGLILGCVVVQMARLYCRGNLLGDRLEIERTVIDEITGRIKRAQGRVAAEREAAHSALVAADKLTNHAETLRQRTFADSLRAVELAWTWFGLPPGDLDREEFRRRALPEVEDTGARRVDLRSRLDLVNTWLANRESIFTSPVSPGGGPALAELTAGEGDRGSALPVFQEKDKLIIVGPTPVEIPDRPKPPHRLMLIGAALTAVVTLATAWLAPVADSGSEETAQGLVTTWSYSA